jgi:glycosyltransferase involved in cell wall biosynthesis
MNPLVTVLMPVYNASLYLEEAVNSILSQTFQNFEFLIIDDGSTDDSVSILKKYNDPRIRLILSEKNSGISATLNKGIELASCELIARMDADDISYPTRLKKQYEYMEAHPECGLLSSWARVITHDKQFVHVEKFPSRFYYYNLNFECWIYHPTVMFRKQVVIKAGMYSKPYSEDYDLFWKIARDFPIANIEEILVDYRQSITSLNTVTKKLEYDIANRENVIRNLQFYMGQDFSIPDDYLECLRHNFIPILKHQTLEPFLDCLRILDEITNAIHEHPNVNLNQKDVSWAAYHKKDFIAEQLFLQLPRLLKFKFLVKVKKPELLFRKIEKSLRWRFNSVKQHLQSLNKP